MLIASSKHYRRSDRDTYLPLNVLMIVLVVAAVMIGSTYNMEGLRNTAIVYFFLWCGEKYTEIYFGITQEIWLFIFMTSVIMYYVALEVNKHPEFVVSIFQSQNY